MKKLFCMFFLFFCLPVFAQEGGGEGEAAIDPNEPHISYFSLNPEIITNYVTPNGEMGYIRVKVDLMVNTTGDLALVTENEPLIRDSIIDVLGQETVEHIRSLKGRDLIRKECADKINARLQKETGKQLVRELLFTNYLYQ